jgi:hypothetical protein
MKHMLCPECGHRTEVADNVVLAICLYCIITMEEEGDGKQQRA